MDRLRTAARIRERYGDRAWAIITLAPFWAFFGLHEILAPAQLSEGTPIEMLPGWVRGPAWLGTATYAVLHATRSDAHRLSITLLMLMPAMRLLSYLTQGGMVAVESVTPLDIESASLPYGPWGWAHSVCLYGLMMWAVVMVARTPPWMEE